MKTKHLICIAALCGAFSIHAQTPPLLPSGPPSDPTTAMKSLNQVEPRTIIGSLPFTITQPGSYYFTGNLEFTAASGDAITVNADHVSIDLNGFTLSSTTAVTGLGIKVSNNGYTTTIRNGTILGATTITVTSNSFIPSGGGFLYGIQMGLGTVCLVNVSGCRDDGIRALGHVTITDVLARKNGEKGVVLFDGGDLEKVKCLGNRLGAYGMTSAVNCVFNDNYTVGAQGSSPVGPTLVNCSADNNGSSGFLCTLAPAVLTGCAARSNSQDGIYVLGSTVTSCLALNNGGYGIRCDDGVANGCVSRGNVNGVGAANGVVSFCTVTGNSSSNISGANVVRTGNNPAP